MAKFKVGDIVVGNGNNWYGITAKGIRCKVVEVCDPYHIRVEFHGSRFTVDPHCFDLVHSNLDDEEITITRHGNKVVAKRGKKVGVAKCSPEDTFDFVTGAKLAFERLIGVTDNTSKPKQKFKTGEFVRVTTNDGTHHFDIGSIVQIVSSGYDDCIKCYGLTHASTNYQFECQYLDPSDVEPLSD
ncbi:MAG: hypothetical protein ACI4WS_12885 [Oscillospiraceae bacterium]